MFRKSFVLTCTTFLFCSSAMAAPEVQSSSFLPTWMYVLIFLIIGIFLFSGFAMFQRKKLFKDMDEVEDWMDSIENKVKSLKPDQVFELQGKADVVATLVNTIKKEYLPNAEQGLMDAENLCERFRFRKAGKQLQQTRDQLGQIDHEISQLQSKMFQSKVAHEESHRLMEEIEKANVLVERKFSEALLQHGGSFQDAREKWTEVVKRFEAVSIDKVNDFSVLVSDLTEMKQGIVEILREIERYPQLKQEITFSIPHEVKELELGIQEMSENGYRVPSDYFAVPLEKVRQEVEQLQLIVSEGIVPDMEEKIEKIKEEIDQLYDTIEEIITKKAMAQHFFAEIPQTLSVLMQERDQLQGELEELSLRYLVDEGPIFAYFTNLKNLCLFVEDQLFLAGQMDTGNDLEYIQAADILEKTYKQMEALIETREVAYRELEQLRSGEYEAQEMVELLHAEIVRVEQQIRRQHLPGVPAILLAIMDDTKQVLVQVEAALQQIPLDLQKVNLYVKEAKNCNTQLNQQAEALFYHCEQAEKKIQQTNRYRSHWANVRELLDRAEQAFRELDFERAHHLADEAGEVAAQYMEGNGRLQFKKKKA